MTIVSARSLDLLLTGWREPATGPTAVPAYKALFDRIRLLILDGRIPLGTRMPAERELADVLHVSRTTVSAAYSDLREHGYLSSVRGSGSVARLPGRAPIAIDSAQTVYLDFSKAAMPATPKILAAAERAVESLPAYLGESGFDPIGLPVLREAIAARYDKRGLPTSPDQIMVTIGAQHAIALVARTVMSRGDRALVENPSYPHACDALKAAGGRLVPVSVTTDDGWDEAALEQAMQRANPSLGYLMPDCHNPTGRSMSIGLRERLLTLAARYGTTLIADETMAELTLDRDNPLPPLGAGPANRNTTGASQTILIGSVGKTIWGGVRVGWIRAERSVIQRLVRARSAGDLGTPILEQLIVAEMLNDFDALLATRRTQLRAGRDHLAMRLAERMPDWTVPHVEGGLTAWVNLGRPVSSQLTLAARAEGLLIAAGPRFGIDGAFERFLRIPFSHSAAEIDQAVDALAAAWGAVARHPLIDSPYLEEVV